MIVTCIIHPRNAEHNNALWFNKAFQDSIWFEFWHLIYNWIKSCKNFFYSLKELPSFEGQSRLERITIPRQVTAIPDRMFAGCSTLVKVTLLPEHPPVLGEEVFPGMEDRLQLIVSDSAVADYQAAEGWKDFFNNFRTPSGEDDTAVGIDTEDEHSMQDETIDIEIK